MSKMRLVSSILFSAFSLLALWTIPSPTAQAHSPHFGGHFGHHGWGGHYGRGVWGGSNWGAYGMGGGFRHAGYGYSSYRFGFPSYSYTSLSIGFPAYRSYYSSYGYGCHSTFYSPVYYRPVLYTPVYYQPTCYRPIQYCPAPLTPVCSISTSPVYYHASSPVIESSPVCSTPICATNLPQESSISRYTPAAAWTEDAIALIDSMAKQGGAKEGYAACKQLMKTHSSLPGHFYTRAAILAVLTKADTAEVQSLLASAKNLNAATDGRDLPGGSLRSYVAKIPNASMDGLLNQIAAKALSKSNDRKSELSVLANFLAMDGQSERASRFQAALDKPSQEPSSTDATTLAMAR